MFEELLLEMRNLETTRTFEIKVPLDEKGFYDRECPNQECQQRFKVAFEDWTNKVRDDQVFCPFCRHEAISTKWHTPDQVKHIESAGHAEIARLVQGALSRGVARSRPQYFGGGLIKMSMSLDYRPGTIPPVIVAKASEAMRQDFTCEVCNCRYASIGASFFCPACGHNSATSSFETTLTTVKNTVGAIDSMRQSLASTADSDTACNFVRQLLEDQFTRLVGAFERINEALFDGLPNAQAFSRKGAIFQRVNEASELWRQASSNGFDRFLSTTELANLNVLFQRRHVLSHRQGIIDQTYLDRSNDRSYTVGQRLVVRDDDVLQLIRLMRKLVNGLRTLVP